MKKIFLSLASFANIKVDEAAIEANDQLIVSEETLNTINASLEEAKGFKQQFEAVSSELTTAKETITKLEGNATADATAIANLKEENATLKSKVEELGKLSGSTRTTSQKEEETNADLGLPAHCDANLEIYKMLDELK
jgi:chromosome segregation ATPase